MQKTSDAMVTVHDLDQAVQEKRRGYSEATMKRLMQSEPALATYIEGLAVHFGHPQDAKDYDLDGTGKALEQLLVIVRAIEIGQYRLYRDSIPTNSPLGRMIRGDHEQDQQGAK